VFSLTETSSSAPYLYSVVVTLKGKPEETKTRLRSPLASRVDLPLSNLSFFVLPVTLSIQLQSVTGSSKKRSGQLQQLVPSPLRPSSHHSPFPLKNVNLTPFDPSSRFSLRSRITYILTRITPTRSSRSRYLLVIRTRSNHQMPQPGSKWLVGWRTRRETRMVPFQLR